RDRATAAGARLSRGRSATRGRRRPGREKRDDSSRLAGGRGAQSGSQDGTAPTRRRRLVLHRDRGVARGHARNREMANLQGAGGSPARVAARRARRRRGPCSSRALELTTTAAHARPPPKGGEAGSVSPVERWIAAMLCPRSLRYSRVSELPASFPRDDQRHTGNEARSAKPSSDCAMGSAFQWRRFVYAQAAFVLVLVVGT